MRSKSSDARHSNKNDKARSIQLTGPSTNMPHTLDLPVGNTFQVSGLRVRDFYVRPAVRAIYSLAHSDNHTLRSRQIPTRVHPIKNSLAAR